MSQQLNIGHDFRFSYESGEPIRIVDCDVQISHRREPIYAHVSAEERSMAAFGWMLPPDEIPENIVAFHTITELKGWFVPDPKTNPAHLIGKQLLITPLKLDHSLTNHIKGLLRVSVYQYQPRCDADNVRCVYSFTSGSIAGYEIVSHGSTQQETARGG